MAVPQHRQEATATKRRPVKSIFSTPEQRKQRREKALQEQHPGEELRIVLLKKWQQRVTETPRSAQAKLWLQERQKERAEAFCLAYEFHCPNM